MKWSHAVLLTSLAVTLTACPPRGPKLVVSEAEVAVLSDAQRASVDAAAAKVAEAEETLEAIKKERESAKRESTIAEQKIKSAEAQLEMAELRYEAAQDSGIAENLLPARDEKTRTTQALKEAEADLAFAEAAERHVSALVREAQAAVYSSKAELEVAKFEAVSMAKSAGGPEYKEQQAKFQAQVAEANLRLAEAKTDVAKAKVGREAARAAREMLRPEPPPEAEPKEEGEPTLAPPDESSDSD